MYGLSPFPEAVQVAGYIRAHSDKGSRIAVLGSEPEIYFYANRRSATGYIYTYSMMEPQPFALAMQDQMIRETEDSRPEYVVFVSADGSWGIRGNSHVEIFKWWDAYSAKNYKVAGVADIMSPDRTEYHWEDSASYHPHGRDVTVTTLRRIGK